MSDVWTCDPGIFAYSCQLGSSLNSTHTTTLCVRGSTRTVTDWNSTVYILCLNWGRETHICVGKLTIIGSDNGLSPGRRQAIIWTNAGILLIGPLGTNFNEILIEIHTFSFMKMHLKMSSAKWRPFCLGLNVLKRFQTFVGCLFSQVYVWEHAIKVNTGH